ncbi:fs-1-N [Drosophila busckii]|uniref:Fs-1-N n=1 Tax=Drosophila busckii TaxID=30019 RepID=A0A0M4ESH6_DROBS|nr:fs-1-N [Drosophila busckii]
MKLLCLLLCVYCAQSSGAGSAKTLAQQRAEVEKLRGELNEAFEAGEPEPEGVIVQPGWTQKTAGQQATPSKVVVNESNLKAAQQLRQEINQAVRQQGQTQEVKELEAAIKAKTAAAEKDSALGSAQQEMLGAAQEDDPQLQTNVVDAAALDIDLEQLQQLELSKRRTREMLQLSRIEEEMQFELGVDVQQWLQFMQNGSVYLLGRRSNDLLVLQWQEQNFQTIGALPLPAEVTTLISWELPQGSVLLLASEQQLLWQRLQLQPLELQPIWQWPLGNSIEKLLPFAWDNRDYLALVQQQTLSIYAYNMSALEFWIVQRLRMEAPITTLAVLDTARELLLAVGQPEQALIYAQQSGELTWQLRQRLAAPQLLDIEAFQMGGRSYLALGGQQPQILAYVQGQLLPRTLLGQNFGHVERFLAVPVRSYRDDLLLLVQHRVHFDTHSLLQLEVLIWNGEAFEASLPPPCVLGAQTRYGASCLLDEQREAGLKGATLLRQQQMPMMLLVPRQAAPSGLFRLHTQLLPRNSELHDLQEIYDFMRQWLQEQDKELAAMQSELQQLHTPLLVNEGAHIEQLFVNDLPWTEADAQLDLHTLLQDIRVLKDQLPATGARDKRQPQSHAQIFPYHYEQLDVDYVLAEQLSLQRWNDLPFYVQNATLQFNGSLNVQQLQVLQPRVLPQAAAAKPSSNQLQRLLLKGNLDCKFINGIEWHKFNQNLVWRREPLHLSQLLVQGPIVFEDSLHLSSLNELSFPDDYLWSQGSATTVVHAPKQFTQTLSVNALDTVGAINGRDPLDAITLSDDQEWPGLVSFSQLEVSEQLQLNGSAQGREFEDAPLNPTLQEAQHITAGCHFAKLLVQGPLRLRGLLDNSSFEALLGDLAQRQADANEEIVIAGLKQIEKLALPVDAHVADGQVSGIPLEQFVTKHTTQQLDGLSSLAGFVYFHRLNVSGSYDGVQLEQLQREALRVDAPLKASSTRLRFEQAPQVAQLEVIDSLNDVALTDYQTLLEPVHLQSAHFDNLQAAQLNVQQDVTGAAKLNGQTLQQLLKQQQTLPSLLQVQDLILPNGVQAAQLQGLQAELLLNFLQQLDELPLLILHGQLQVQHITVQGAVQALAGINGHDLAQLQRDVVWLDREQELHTSWRFEQPVSFASDLSLNGSYNELHLLPEVMQDVVWRSEQPLTIVGTKRFTGHLQVLEQLQLHGLNGVPMEHVAHTLKPLVFQGNVSLAAALNVHELQLLGELNGHSLEPLQEKLSYSTEYQQFVVRGVVPLPALELEELTVLGHLGNRSYEPLQQFFDNLVYKSETNPLITSPKIFNGRVSLEGGVHVQQLNGVNLTQLLPQLIYLDEAEVTITSPVRFMAPISMKQLEVSHLSLPGHLLNGCNITDWIYDTVRVDKNWEATVPLSFAAGSLDYNALEVSQLNHLNLSNLITLHTPQELSMPLLAKELHLTGGQVVFTGLVNEQYNLTEEYANTLLTESPHVQRVETPLVLQSIDVTGNVYASAPVNGNAQLNLSDVASSQEAELVLQTPIYFSRLLAPELLSQQQQLNGFDFTSWHSNSLWSKGRATQRISGNWSVRWLRVKQAPENAEIRQRRQLDAVAWRQNFGELCQRIGRLFGLLPYKLTQLRSQFAIKQTAQQRDLRRVLLLQDGNYLLLNEQGCWTRVYRWNGTGYKALAAFESGPVDELWELEAVDNNSFSFVTRNQMAEQSNCSNRQQLQSWRLAGEQLEMLKMPKEKFKQLQVEQPLDMEQPWHSVRYINASQVESDTAAGYSPQQLVILRQRLLQQLSFRLQTEVSITQLSIPERDLYEDEQLLEQVLNLMTQLPQLNTLPLPNTPARVLAWRSVQLTWQALEELQALEQRYNATQEQQQQQAQLQQFMLQLLDLAYEPGQDDSSQLHDVIARLRELQAKLEVDQEAPVSSSSSEQSTQLPQSAQAWRSVETIRLDVGRGQQTHALYARLTLPITMPMPSIAHVQLYYGNGSLFQTLPAADKARHLVQLRVREETLLAFVEHCCQVRVFIYRGLQGFVPFAQFQAPFQVLQLLMLRLPLSHAPGARYMLAVAQPRQLSFYELLVPGLLEPWLHCN